jgi:TPR repeat protein
MNKKVFALLIISLPFIYYSIPKSEKSFFNIACDNGSMESCYQLGVIYYYGSEHIEKDTKKAMNLYLKACSGKVRIACDDLGHMYLLEKDKEKALDFYSRACTFGYKQSCENFNDLINTK